MVCGVPNLLGCGNIFQWGPYSLCPSKHASWNASEVAGSCITPRGLGGGSPRPLFLLSLPPGPAPLRPHASSISQERAVGPPNWRAAWYHTWHAEFHVFLISHLFQTRITTTQADLLHTRLGVFFRVFSFYVSTQMSALQLSTRYACTSGDHKDHSLKKTWTWKRNPNGGSGFMWNNSYGF